MFVLLDINIRKCNKREILVYIKRNTVNTDKVTDVNNVNLTTFVHVFSYCHLDSYKTASHVTLSRHYTIQQTRTTTCDEISVFRKPGINRYLRTKTFQHGDNCRSDKEDLNVWKYSSVS